MSLFSSEITIPLWLFIIMLLLIMPAFLWLARLFDQLRKGEIETEENSDMVVFRVKNRRHSAKPKNKSATINDKKKDDGKADLVNVLKVLIKEGDKGVRIQTITDQMGTDQNKVKNALERLVENKMAEEVSGISGTKYYLTQAGRDYCQRKSR